jgi:N-acetylmuramic acid 6-phosphate etherase
VFSTPLKPAKTEQQNPRSRGLDRKSTIDILRILNGEDARVASAVRRELPRIAMAADAVVKAISDGGRLIYIGAGTSGRMAVLDAAECPPTFGTDPSMVQAIIAGGERALRFATEDAEDSSKAGALDFGRAEISRHDIVVGISASGSTPYVLGAITFAKKRGIATVGITSNGGSLLAKLADIPIVVDTGPEAVTGSTRLKAGTAQKMVLNLLSTAVMVRTGRVYDNWMIHVALTNAKLKRRGAQILQDAAGVDASTAEHALRKAKHKLPVALIMLRAGVNALDATEALAAAKGNVREAFKMSDRVKRKAVGKAKSRTI